MVQVSTVAMLASQVAGNLLEASLLHGMQWWLPDDAHGTECRGVVTFEGTLDVEALTQRGTELPAVFQLSTCIWEDPGTRVELSPALNL